MSLYNNAATKWSVRLFRDHRSIGLLLIMVSCAITLAVSAHATTQPRNMGTTQQSCIHYLEHWKNVCAPYEKRFTEFFNRFWANKRRQDQQNECVTREARECPTTTISGGCERVYDGYCSMQLPETHPQGCKTSCGHNSATVGDAQCSARAVRKCAEMYPLLQESSRETRDYDYAISVNPGLRGMLQECYKNHFSFGPMQNGSRSSLLFQYSSQDIPQLCAVYASKCQTALRPGQSVCHIYDW